MKTKVSHSKRKPKVTKVTKAVGTLPKPSVLAAKHEASRAVAATHTFKKLYGKRKVLNPNEVKRVVKEYVKPKYSAEGSKCKECSYGILKLSQWNRAVCNKCWYSELV